MRVSRVSRGRSLRSVPVLAAFVLSGCYNYVPVERPAPGTEVRAQVPMRSTVEGSRRAPELVPFEGRVVSFGDTLRLETRTEQRVGTRSFVAVDTIRIDAESLAAMEERVFSRGRTAVFTVALAGGVALATWGIASVTGGDEGGKPGNGGTASDRPVIFQVQRHGLRIFGIALPFP